MVYWFTGLPASGKSTISRLVGKHFENVVFLDGDELRKDLCKDLGFSREDRKENLRRVGLEAKRLHNAGHTVMCSLVSPYLEDRLDVRKLFSPADFTEIYIRTQIETCIRRDPKGLYAKALAKEIDNFTGIDGPYEETPAPDVIVKTEGYTPEETTEQVMRFLKGVFIVVHIPKTGGIALQEALPRPQRYSTGHVIADKHVQPGDWGKYTVVACVRNPFDRLYSVYSFFKTERNGQIKPNITFEDVIINYEQDYMNQQPWFKSCSDYIGSHIDEMEILRFENLAADFDNFCKKYSTPNKLSIKNTNKHKVIVLPKDTIYTPEMREIVERVFEKDLETFNYTYEQWVNSDWGN